MDKKDLEELEEWKNKKLQYVETYGIDIFNPKKPNKTTVKILNILDRVTKVFLIILIILIIVVLFGGLIGTYVALNEKVHINPRTTLSKMYGVHVKVISKNLDKNRNGEYYLTIKENKDIQFRAITQWKQMQNDYSDRCEKYYFEKWQSEHKNKLKVEENYNNGLLDYSIYIEIENVEQLLNATTILHEFVQSANKLYFPDWNVYIKLDKYRIYPFSKANMTKEQAIESARSNYEYLKSLKDIPKVDDTDRLIREIIGGGI